MKDAVIFDMDGTLCDVSGVRHHLLRSHDPFRHFHEASIDCPPHPDVVLAARQAHEEGLAVLIVTAREARFRNVTAMWLALHDVPSDVMYMRATGDFRPDYVIKEEILTKIKREFTVIEAWDDNPSVIDLWRSEGILTHVVPGWGSSIKKEKTHEQR